MADRSERVQSWIETNIDKTRKAMMIMDNIPKVDPSKLVKLTEHLTKKIKEKTTHIPLLVKLPQDADQVTLGFALIAFDSVPICEEVCRTFNNFKMDKSHIVKTNMFEDWDKFRDVPDDYVPDKVDMDNFCSENLYEYLCDEAAREQFFIRYAGTMNKHNMEIYWNDYQVTNANEPMETMKLKYEKKNWTNLFAKWSPLGTYLVTFTPKGLKLWGGEQWSLMGEFPHVEVQFIDFSPKEKFLITWGSELVVWDVQICKKVKRVNLPYSPGERCPFKWSHDEQFLAKLGEHDVLLYDLDHPKMRLVQQPDTDRATTIYVQGIKAIEWSPTDNYFCYWVPEENNTPARVTLVEVLVTLLPDGTKSVKFETISQRNLYRVENIHMTWHPQGDFLACKVERKKKSNQVVSAYELFRIRHKDCAVETIELPEQVIAFDFEPKGHRFVLIHGPSDVKLSVSFYTMSSVTKGEVRLLGTYSDKKVNHIYWSPKGKYCLLAGLRQPFNGMFEFWHVGDRDKLELLDSTEHFMCSNVNWDASGRFVTTFVSQAYHQMENGFKTWTFQGTKVCEKKIDKFYQFEWRPRPQSVLTDKEVKGIIKGRTTWEKKFQTEETNILQRDIIEKKTRMAQEMAAYKDRIKAIKKHFSAQTRERNELINKFPVPTSFRLVNETIEEIIERKETRLSRT